MPKSRIWILLGVTLLITTVAGGWQIGRVAEVRGYVRDGERPIAGAVVRIKTTNYQTLTNENGAFVLKGVPPAVRIHVTAWADGYYIAGTTVWPGRPTANISLRRYWTSDNPDYSWIPPAVKNRSGIENLLTQAGLSAAARVSFNHLFLPLSSTLPLGCADCHGSIIYKQYDAGAHAQGTKNIRFLTMYNGTDVDGNRSPLTRYGFHRDYGLFPLRPALNQPWYGPGFKLDFPDQAGICATCHIPGEAISAPHDTDINRISPEAVQGVHCDFCHKVVDVRLNPATLLPQENMPGVLSMELRRPNGEPQMFFGPFDDVDVGPDTFSPLQNESRFCAACHNASFWGTPVYQFYAEWLASPYPQEGKTCQSCHMKPDGVTTNFAPGRGGQNRDPNRIFTHQFPGAEDEELLKNTAKLELVARQEGGRVQVQVRVTNENAGHHLPTDHPARNALLAVSATDAQGRELQYVGEQVIPDWGGVGDALDDYGGRPGKGYAKILEELWTEVAPTAAYWRQTVIREDTRLAARATDETFYEFRAAQSGPVTVEARLIFRRAFKELARVKKWGLRDIEMEHETITVP